MRNIGCLFELLAGEFRTWAVGHPTARDGQPLGDTVFANTIAAYEALPDSMKQRLADLRAIHHRLEIFASGVDLDLGRTGD
jgi:alpha-ketoglutarate-dependent taurine dioxygenase